MWSFCKRICCLVLVLSLLGNMIPVVAQAAPVAVAAGVAPSPAPAATAEIQQTQAGAEIIGEVPSGRSQYAKEYVLSNGLHMAAVYGEAVHYQKDGQWLDIDNTLKPVSASSDASLGSSSGSGQISTDSTLGDITATAIASGYTNTAGVWDVQFPGELSKNTGVTITKDGYTLSFFLTGQLKASGDLSVASTDGSLGSEQLAVEDGNVSQAQVQTVDLSRKKAAAQYPELVSDTLHSRLLYANVFENTNIAYDLVSDQVKESIVIGGYSQNLRGYRYVLNVGNMVPVLQQSGEIHLYDPTQTTVIMAMPAPYLVDAAGEYNYEVSVSLTGSGDTYTLTYRLPDAWMADSARRYPVVLDPVVSADINADNISDRTIGTHKNMAQDSGSLLCGYFGSYGALRSFIKYNEIPQLSASDVVVSAQISMYEFSTYTGNRPVYVHKVLSTWESETLSYDNRPDYDPTVEDYAIVRGNGLYSWDVTDLVQQWYAGENTGMMFKSSDEIESATNNRYAKFYSSDYSDYQYEEKPILCITFRNNNGLESYWDYTAASAGRAGTGYVNSFTGNLVWTRADIGFGGNRMPVSISHVYTANDSQNDFFGMGYGWRTNYNQRVYLWSQDENYYVWEDADGTRHYFLNDGNNTYKDEDGLELTLTTGGTGLQTYCITDRAGNASYFDANGRLSQQCNNQQTTSSCIITYTAPDSFQIATVTDGTGRVYRFTYGDGLLTRIGYYGSSENELAHVAYSYTDSNLTAITDQDGKTAALGYTDNHLLTTAEDIDGYKLVYTYNTTATGKPNRITRIQEFSGTTPGGELNIEYAHNQTTFTDFKGNRQIMQFNNWGNTVSVQDQNGLASFAGYANNDAATQQTKGNQLSLSSKLQNTVGNMITGSSFENGTAWTALDASVTCTTTSGEAFYGSKSAKLVSTGDTTGGIAGPSVTLASGKTYTFSAWVKTGGCEAYLSLGGSTSETLAANSGWTRLEVSFTNSGNEAVSLSPQLMTSGAGTAYLDCVQLEQAPTASRYNLVENGDFRDNSAWSSSDTITSGNTPPAPELDGRAYTVTGSPTQQKLLTQTVAVSGSAGDTFVLAGWAKGDAAPFKNGTGNVPEFGLQAIFRNTDGSTTETAVVRFNPDVDSSVNWQYAAAPIVADKAYSSIEVRILYHYNVNTVSFDGIQLYKEAFGSSYTYDDNGNVISVVDLQKQTTTYEYDEFENLTGVNLPTGAKLTYTYDGYHNVLTATSETGVCYAFTYDTYGNNTSVSILGNELHITSRAAYSEDGNLLLSTTDALGNVTSYGYEENTGLLLWVQYPEDTAESRTQYTYDNMYRLATTTAQVEGQALSASYTYEDDYLTSLQTGSTTYSFAYGAFGLRENIRIGSRTLAAYTYTSRDNQLAALDYGNGDKVEYTYDSQGRITQETYENGDTVSYRYDNSGALATVTDSATGRTTTYYYDFTDRLMKTVVQGTDFCHSLGYEYDSINNLTKLVNTINGVALETSYSYDLDNRITGQTQGSTNLTYHYDGYSRLNQVRTKHTDTTLLIHSYEFRRPTSGATTGQVEKHTIGTTRVMTRYSYTYDDNGNILSVSDGTNTTSYAYDTANQLIRENNQAAGKTTTWTYDNAGNILTRREYAYTTAENPGTPTDTVNYTYGDESWGDLLTAYDGVAITYDEIGNPLTDGTYTYTWEHGRQLRSISDGTTTWTYTYDASGLRTSASNGTVTDQYVYTGGQLTMMRKNGICFYFTYDANGSPCTISYGTNTFYYVTNLQGDVIALLDSSGATMAEYTYDAWGNPLTVTGPHQVMAEYNPLRYRGYVYDTATGLYYLQSRYYNPEIGRFLNADGFTSTGQGLLGTNMFAYCGNNPVNRTDSTGQSWAEIWEFIKEVVSEVGNAMGVASSAYNGCSEIAFADGPLPFGDVIALVSAGIITLGAIGYGFHQAVQAPSIAVPKAEAKAEAIAVPQKPDSEVFFPADPNCFNPVGLIKTLRHGTKNGMLISWMDPITNIEVFRWDENPNYPNGPHYHIHGCGHYYAGEAVPDFYAKLYFPFN